MSEKKSISIKDFARLFARTRNPRESAIGAGENPDSAALKGEEMLSRKIVRQEVSRIEKENPENLSSVRAGLSRLAFGSVNEAAALVFEEEPAREEILRADLFNVSEIKKVKGGGVEMKFFDRQKALEKLVEFNSALKEVNNAQQFINALFEKSKNCANDPEESEKNNA